jgi:hypothetical protein
MQNHEDSSMVNSFKIVNYKGFRELDLPDLARITLLGGRNNAGKTSVLETLFMFFDRQNPQMTLRQYNWRGVEVLPMTSEYLWQPIFHDFDMSREIDFCATINEQSERMTLRFAPDYIPELVDTVPIPLSANGNRTPVVNTGQAAAGASALEVQYQFADQPERIAHIVPKQGDFLLIPTTPVPGIRPVAIITARDGQNQTQIAARFGELDIIGKQNEIVQFLQIIEPRLTSLSVIVTERLSMVYGDIGLPRKIPVAYMGEGMFRLLTIVVSQATVPSGLLLIDEIESGLHYSVMPDVWKSIARAAREFNCQVIATTHSYECLQAAVQGLAGEAEDEFRYIRLDRKEGNVQAKSFDYRMLKTATDAHLEVR